MKPANALTRFSDRVEEYVKYRPGYPPDVLETLRKQCGLTSSAVVADIGSGPGNLARLLLANGNEVYAVEPNREMRAAGLELLGNFPRYHGIDGKAEATSLASASVDFVTAAQAFHWFDGRRTKIEFQRILRPRGWVVLIWNERITDSTPFLRDYEKLLLDYSTDYNLVRHENSYEDVPAFFSGSVQEACFENRQVFDFEGVRGRLLSSSYAPSAESPRREPMLRKLRRLFDEYNQDGRIALEYKVRMYFGQLA